MDFTKITEILKNYEHLSLDDLSKNINFVKNKLDKIVEKKKQENAFVKKDAFILLTREMKKYFPLCEVVLVDFEKHNKCENCGLGNIFYSIFNINLIYKEVCLRIKIFFEYNGYYETVKAINDIICIACNRDKITKCYKKGIELGYFCHCDPGYGFSEDEETKEENICKCRSYIQRKNEIGELSIRTQIHKKDKNKNKIELTEKEKEYAIVFKNYDKNYIIYLEDMYNGDKISETNKKLAFLLTIFIKRCEKLEELYEKFPIVKTRNAILTFILCYKSKQNKLLSCIDRHVIKIICGHVHKSRYSKDIWWKKFDN